MSLPRIRTLKEAFAEIKEQDPKSAITFSYLRRIAPDLPGTIKAGSKWLLNMEELEKYLSDPERLEKDRLREYERAKNTGGIRPVSV